MSLDATRIQFLMQQFAADQLTEEELNEWQLLLSGPDREMLTRIVMNLIEQESINGSPVDKRVVQESFNKIILVDAGSRLRPIRSIRPIHRVHFLRRWGWTAACVLLILAAGGFFLVRHQRERISLAGNTTRSVPEILPGRQGAVLTLDDGKQVVLDSLGAGIIATQNGTKVILKKGQLTYDPSERRAGEMTFNTMTTPKGRQFHLRLPDGTEAWLNAASSIRYPTSFKGKERIVEITGEVYFEVAESANMPFKVNTLNQAHIEVLGTHFNVNAYPEGAEVKATLLEGSVLVNKDSRKTILKPGEQAQIGNVVKIVKDANIEKIMAWKNGLFNFEGLGLREVMQQLERWYDIEVVYDSNVPDIKFYGELSRDMNLSGIIAALKDSEVHFRIEGRKLIVLP